jgi:hypothetical protein
VAGLEEVMQNVERRRDIQVPDPDAGEERPTIDRSAHLGTAAGVVLLSLPVISVIGFLFGIPLGDTDPFARGDLEDFLQTIHDHNRLYALSLAAFAVQDVIVLPAVATLMYLLFRDRSRSLALLSAFGMLIGAACSAIHDAGALTLGVLAHDFIDAGGPPGTAAGDPAILEVARSVSVLQASTALMATTGMALGVIALALVVGWSPTGERVPPRWLAYTGLIGGVCYLSMWSFFLNHVVGGTFTLLGELGIMIMTTGMGIWFLRHPKVVERS